jgi:YidC/Oxa1 family membrane protein insertase
MEKRALAAIGLSILVLLSFRYFEERRMKETAKSRPPIQRQVPSPQQAPTNAAEAPAAAAATPAEQPLATAPGQASDSHAAVQKVVVEGSIYRAELDNRGALLFSWHLNNYRTGNKAEFEMIAANHMQETRPFPGALVFDDPNLTALANGELYEVDIQGGSAGQAELTPPATVTMRLRRGDLLIEKTFHFHKENYLVDFSVKAVKAGQYVPGRILLGQDIGPEYEHLLNPSAQLQAIYNLDGKVKRDSPPKDENPVRKGEGNVRWAGLDMHYFTIIAIPNRAMPEIELQKRPVKTTGLDQKEVTRDLLRLTLPTPGQAAFQIFLGPKKQDYLDAVKGADLAGVIDYGMFWFLVRPLLVGLVWIHQYAHNWGLAIILLTLLLTLLLFPFRIKQILSMKKMAVVQPKIKEIQEKYKRYKKTDPKRAEMNQEVMAVYKAHNVNPLGGCLPLLLQMPLLFAFYSLLAYSIELRQAPFFGWIQDLAQKDPYYVLPIIMGVTMLISQKMTPMTPGTDPTQAKMMMLMPVIFTVMFFNVSSGLNLYFLCSNIFQIGFQKVAERWIGDRRPAVKSRQ